MKLNPTYGMTRELPDVDFDEAIRRTTEALASQGFGILTEIDVKATLHKKLGVDFPRYTILGACNPPLAHRALTGDPGVGLLLPCNVVVAEREEGGSVVSAIDPKAMFQVVSNPDIEPIVEEARQRLQQAIEAI